VAAQFGFVMQTARLEAQNCGPAHARSIGPSKSFHDSGSPTKAQIELSRPDFKLQTPKVFEMRTFTSN